MKLIKKIILAKCYIHTHFKIYCPGCGGTRAFLSLIRGHIIKSVYYNPMILLLIMDVLLINIFNFIDKKNPTSCKMLHYKIRLNVGLLIVWFIYFIGRNYLLIAWKIDLVGDFLK